MAADLRALVPPTAFAPAVTIAVALGEAIDKLTILEIKKEGVTKLARETGDSYHVAKKLPTRITQSHIDQRCRTMPRTHRSPPPRPDRGASEARAIRA